mgnify:FL=1
MKPINTGKYACLALVAALGLSACNGGGGGADGVTPPAAGDSTTPTAGTSTGGSGSGSGSNSVTPPAEPMNVFGGRQTAKNHLDVLRAALEAMFLRPMWYPNGGKGRQTAWDRLYLPGPASGIQACAIGGRRIWAFHDTNNNGFIDENETGKLAYDGCMMGQAGELSIIGAVDYRFNGKPQLQANSQDFHEDWNVTMTVPGRQLRITGPTDVNYTIFDANAVHPWTNVGGTASVYVTQGMTILENGQPYLDILNAKLDFNNVIGPTSMQYNVVERFTLRGQETSAQILITFDSMGNYSDFTAILEDLTTHDLASFETKPGNQILYRYYRADTDITKPLNDTMYNWTDILPGGY